MCQLVSSVTRDFEGAWIHVQSVGLHFLEHCNAYELLLKTICNIRSAISAMHLYMYKSNFDG